MRSSPLRVLVFSLGILLLSCGSEDTTGPGNLPPTVGDLQVTVPKNTTSSISVPLSDPDGDALTASLILSTQNGTLTLQVVGSSAEASYTPFDGFEGFDSFTFQVSDGTASVQGTVQIEVSGAAPTASAPKTTIERAANGDPVRFQISATDPDGDQLSFRVVAGPAGGTVTSFSPGDLGSQASGPEGAAPRTVNAVASYIPNPGFAATDAFTVVATDGDNESNPIVFTVAVNGRPVAASRTVQASAGIPADLLLSATDSDNDDLTFEIVAGPSSGSLSATSGDLTDGSATLTYTSTPGFEGSDVIRYVVRDDLDTSAEATVTVRVANQPPTTQSFEVTTDRAEPITIDLTATDPEGDPVTFEIRSGPSGGSLSSVASTGQSTAEVTYSPSPATVGSDSFTFVARDGTGVSAVASVLINIISDAPVVTPVTPSTLEDTPVVINLVSSSSVGLDLSFSVIAGPANGSVGAVTPGGGSPVSTATVTYTPDADYYGSDAITVEVDDGSLTSELVIPITVLPVNEAPSFTAGTGPTVNEDSGAFSQAVTGFVSAVVAGPGPEATDQTVTFGVTAVGTSGLFSAQPTVVGGNLTFTPAVDANGTSTVTLVATDDGGTANGGVDASAGQQITITVNAVNDAPSFTVGADESVASNAGAQSVAAWATDISAGPADESGQTVGFTVTNEDNGLFSVQPAVSSTGTLTYTPVGMGGMATVTVTASDDGGTANGGVDTSAGQTFTITVVNTPPTAVDNEISITEDDTPSGNVITDAGVGGTDSDFDGGTLSVTEVNGSAANVGSGFTLPSGASLTVNSDGSYDYDPTVAFDSLQVDQAETRASPSVLPMVGGAPHPATPFTPTWDFTDSDSFTYTLSDGQGGTDVATVSIDISGVDDGPVGTPIVFDAPYDANFTLRVDNPLLLGSLSDPEGEPAPFLFNGFGGIWSASLVDTPDSVTIDLTVATNPGLLFLDEGETLILDGDFLFEDVVAPFTVGEVVVGNVRVTGVNDAPTPADDMETATPGVDLFLGPTVGVLSNDTDPDTSDEGALFVTEYNGTPADTEYATPLGGTITIGPSGAFLYNIPPGNPGTDVITYTVSDGDATATATLEITNAG